MSNPTPGGHPVFIEQPRVGRRPRYHTGYLLDSGTLLGAEACNLDQGALGHQLLDELPQIPRPRSQLCRRCFRGDPRLAIA